MPVNSSSSTNASLLPHASNSSFHFVFYNCFDSVSGNFIFTSFTAVNILLVLPLSVAVLQLGHQRYRQHVATSHCDVITFHMAVVEVISVIGSVAYCVSVYTRLPRFMMVASHVFFVTSCGQMSFHILTCAERYVAVVHPVTYLRLRHGGGVRIRNGLVWFIWLLAFGKMNFAFLNNIDVVVMVYFGEQMLSLAAVSLCSLSVLRSLRRAGPGEGSGDRVDLSKRRTCYTILGIMGALLLRFGGCMVCTALYSSLLMSHSDRCVVIELGYFFCLPSSLVLPLLYLHRVGKLPCDNNK